MTQITSSTHETTSQPVPFRFAVAATFTADPLKPVIAFWGTELSTSFELRFAPFNQVIQSLLDPSGILATNTHGVNIVLLRLEDLGQPADLESNVRHIAEELRAAPFRLSVPLLVTLCPSSRDFASRMPQPAGHYETLLEAALEETPGAQFIPHSALDQCYPVPDPHSPEGEKLGGIPYTESWFCALGTMLVRHTHALLRPPFKLIALDCDNTLWQGICGEDGPENVWLDPARKCLHEFMLDQREDGLLLTLASKNNEEDVLETFRVHPEMPLQPRHFVTWRLNWEPKAASLASIAEQLSLGLDSFIFIDDNPKECAELQDSLPEVLTLALPEDITKTPHFLAHVWAFDHPVVTEEDRNRNAYYERQAEFGNQIRRARSLDDFLETLELRVDISPLTPEKLPRTSQLTQRTNQFNTTTIRRLESDIQALASEGAEVFTVDVTDRFGDYGLVGVMIVRRSDSSLEVESLLLSCRALGRGVEHHMLAAVGKLAGERGIGWVRVPYRRTAKNHPALHFLESIPEAVRSAANGNGFVLQIASDALKDLRWNPGYQLPQPAPRSVQRPVAVTRSVDYTRIASELSTVPQILSAMRGGTGVSADLSLTETERKLTAIWSDLLDRKTVARTDNFFDLGGHSLVAVLLLMRIKEIFNVELSIDDVYSGSLTLAGLADRVEAAQFSGIDPDEYAALLAEMDSLTDEEARELLARESAPS